MSITTEEASSSADEQTASSDPKPSVSTDEPSDVPGASSVTVSGAKPQVLATSVRDASGSAGDRTSSARQATVSGPNPVLAELKNVGVKLNDDNPGATEQKVKLEDKQGLAEPLSHKAEDVVNRGQLGLDAPPERQEKDANRRSSKKTEENKGRAGSLGSESSTFPESEDAGDSRTGLIPEMKREGSSGSEPTSSSGKPGTSSEPTEDALKCEKSTVEHTSCEGDNSNVAGKGSGSAPPGQIQQQDAITGDLSTYERKDSLLSSTVSKSEESFESESEDGSARNEGGARAAVPATKNQEGGDRNTFADPTLSASQKESSMSSAKKRFTMEEQRRYSLQKSADPTMISRSESYYQPTEVAPTDRREDGELLHSTKRLSQSFHAHLVGKKESYDAVVNGGAISGMKPPSGIRMNSSSQGVPFRTTNKTPSSALLSHLPFGTSRTFSVTEMLRPDLQKTATEVGSTVPVTTSMRREISAASLFPSDKDPSEALKSKLVLDDVNLPVDSAEAQRYQTRTTSKKLLQTQEETQSHDRQSWTKHRAAGILKQPVQNVISTVPTHYADRPSVPPEKRSHQTDVSLSRKEELMKPGGHELRDTVVQGNDKITMIKSVPIADERLIAERANKRMDDASEIAVNKTNSKKLQIISHHSSNKHFSEHPDEGSKACMRSNDVALPDSSQSSPIGVQAIEMDDIAIADHVQSNTAFGVRIESESNKEKDLLGVRRSRNSTAGTYSHKSTTAPTAPDLAHTDNLTVADPGVHVVRQQEPPESYLYPMAICLAIALLFFLGYLFWPSSEHPSQDEPTAYGRHSVSCNSTSCHQNAVYLGNLLSWRDVDPCKDFYAFVCRRWHSRFTTHFTDKSISTDDDYVAFLEHRVYVSIRNGSGRSKILRPLRYLYDKCMNVRLIEDEGWNALLELMSDLSLDGFPLTPPVRESISVWSTAAKILRKTGSAALLSVGVASYSASPKKDIVSVGPPELLTTTGKADANEAIRLHAAAVFAVIKALRKDYVPPVEILATVKFASDLEKLGESRVNTDASKINVLDSPSDMLEFLTAVFRGREGYIFTGARSYVAIHSPELVNDVIDLVLNTEPHTVMNYLGVRLMIQVSPFVPEAGVTNFYSTMAYGKPKTDLPRWQLCVRATEKALYPLVHGTLFHDARLKSSMPSITDVVSKTIARFIAGVDASSLFEDSSKAAIRRILSTTAVDIVSPSWINDTASIADYVNGLPAFKATRRGLDTYVAFFQHTFFDSLSRGTRTRWSRSIFSAKCWYEPYPRTVYVPLVALNVTQALEGNGDDYVQLSRLTPRLSRCLLDMLIEESNSTDDTVRWLTEDTRSRLTEVENCLRGTSKSVDFWRLRDVLAARLAFSLFQESVAAKQELETSLQEGRVLTSAQVFFVYLMLQSCETLVTPDQSWPPGVDNWTIALSDSGDFARAFNCTAGSPMSAKQSCLG
ncbi:hypothetical protein HPB50_010276 [Hyalomma asiaticum]|uniref:Uncharacterized protein n=1 Tax=Hyalomma asiaticum TaxID=266040 RepID=A0ACB7SV24_HYAAI|nr:hypothetical protein HPB50_010276 [Hyalomma asiaticum]